MHNPTVPETLEGWCVLHQMFRVDWPELRLLSESERHDVTSSAEAVLRGPEVAEEGASAVVRLLGHKGDMMVVHFRRSFDGLSAAQFDFSRSSLHEFLQPTTSYVSIVELGMYEMTAQIHGRLKEKGLAAGTPEFEKAFDAEMEEQRKHVVGRLFQEVPARRHVCFYPMNKRRGEHKNWYAESFDARAEMMREHGTIGRHYSGQVTQIISGSIGFDDWEWGVDLFADEPLVFKKLIYEMRFDKASAEFAEFGPFYVGLQFSAHHLGQFLAGVTPPL